MNDPYTFRTGRDAPPPGYVDLRKYTQMLRRSTGLIALIVALVVGLAATYSYTRQSQYTATAKVLVLPTGLPLADASSVGFSKVLSMPTEAETVKSLPVATIAAQALNTSAADAPKLLKRLKVTQVLDAFVLQISFTDPSPQTAAAGALAFAKAYIQYRGDAATQKVDTSRSQLNDRIQVLQNKLRTLGTDPAAQAERAVGRAEIDAYAADIAALEQINTGPGNVIGLPGIPGRPSSPNHKLDIALGLILGVGLGIGLALLRAQTDTRLRDRSRLEDAVGLPVLASIPQDTQWSDKHRSRLVTVENPRSPVAESYRTLRTTLFAAAARRGVRTILVTSPLAGEGKTTTVANLAVVMAQAGRLVGLISADLRKPRVHQFFNVLNDYGLTEVLTGNRPAEQSFHETSTENLWVLPSGIVPVNPAELLQSAEMEGLLREQREIMDFILIDCPPVLAVSDTLGLVPFVDGVLFVADSSSSRLDAVKQAATQLEQVGAPMLGAVLNDFRSPATVNYYGEGQYEPRGTPEAKPGKNGRRSRSKSEVETNG